MMITNPDDLLAQVAAGFQSNCDADVIAEAAELAEVEQARLRLVDRWLATTGPVSIWVVGLPVIHGSVVAAGSGLVVVRDVDENIWALGGGAVVGIVGLAAGLRDERPDPGRPVLTWSKFLRDLTGVLVRIYTTDAMTRSGELVSVGADHLDLITGADGQAGRRITIAFTALVAVQTPARRDG